jgi:nucleoside-diphosphate-sugar epimerase
LSMITGKGLLAKSIESIDRPDCLFFCSGVSDSTETSPAAFERETSLLNAQNTDKKLVYFSTISIFNPAKSDTPYIRHKLKIEALIKSRFPDYLIVRLPNIIGLGGNPSNLFPFLLNKIIKGETVTIHKNARRHLLTASLLPDLLTGLLENNVGSVVNICFENPPEVKEIYLYMCTIMNAVPSYVEGKEESDFTVDNTLFAGMLKMSNSNIKDNWQEGVKCMLLSSGQP